MDGASEFTARSEHGAPAPSAAKTRRSIPPALVHAVDLERLYFTLHIKGLEPGSLSLVTRGRRLGVCFEDRPEIAALGVNAALREIERQVLIPALILDEPAARRRALSLERWACAEVGPAVIWSLLQPVSVPRADSGPLAPVRRALDLIAGLTRRHAYLMGPALSAVDITLASVLAPIARKDGWIWAGRLWTPLAQLAGRSALSSHTGAAWVRRIYDVHAKTGAMMREPARAWVP